MRDYAGAASVLGVSHLLFFSQTEANLNLRIARHPDGPTLHFRILQFFLPRQIKALQKRPFESTAAYRTAPIVVLNNFGQAEEVHLKLLKITFQHMFPTINVKTVQLSSCRRVVLFHYNKESDSVEMRHYAIRAQPVGISKSIKRVIQAKIPNLGRLTDISEFLEGPDAYSGGASDSEAEDEGSKVTLPERYVGRGNIKSQVSAMKLVELGPRLTLELYKVQQGVNDGDILYHKFVQKTPEEAAAIKARVEKEKQLKEMRRKAQEENVKRKRDEQKEKADRKKQRREAREQGALKDGDEDADDEDDDDDHSYGEEDKDDDEVEEDDKDVEEEDEDEQEEEEED